MSTVVLIGDSIRLGYENTVREQLTGRATIWTPRENGEDSRKLRRQLADWVLDRRPDLVHLNCGLHDVKRDARGENIQVPLADYRANLEDILTRLRAAGIATCWATTTPVHEEHHRTVKNFVRRNADIDACNAAARELAGRFGVPVNDLHATVLREGPDRLLQADGVHYTAAGYALLGTAVAMFLGERL